MQTMLFLLHGEERSVFPPITLRSSLERIGLLALLVTELLELAHGLLLTRVADKT